MMLEECCKKEEAFLVHCFGRIIIARIKRMVLKKNK